MGSRPLHLSHPNRNAVTIKPRKANMTTFTPHKKRASLEIIYPQNYSTDERMEWHKGHGELKELQFSSRAMARFSEIRRRVDNLAWTIMRIYEDSERNTWTHEKQLSQLTEWVYNTATYRKLPSWGKNELAGVVFVLRAQQNRKLVWTHVLDGKRVKSGSPELSGRYHELKDGESAHCWQKPDGTFVRFS